MISDWNTRPLSDFLTHIVGGGTPSRKVTSYWEGNIPWASVKDFQDDTQVIGDTTERISSEGLKKSASKLIPPGVLLICVRMAIGRVAITTHPIAINQDVKALYTNDLLLPKYLFYLIHIHRQKLEALSIGSTVKGLSLKHLLSLSINVPLPSVQCQISALLDTVDEQIQHAEKLIHKLKLQRTGLLQKLLTCGIDEKGKMRDPRTHPELFKDTVVGKVPQEWDVSTLGDIVLKNGGLIQTGPFGSQLHAHEYVTEGVPVIMPQNIKNERINTSQIARITPIKASKLSRHFVVLNDVVFGRRGDLDRCAFIDISDVGSICGTDCLLVRPPKDFIDGRWLAAIYRHYYSQVQIRAKAVGSTMLGLNTSLLTSLVIARPTLEEQVLIMDKCSLVDVLIRTEEVHRNKLKLYKNGLMQDLLTGKVRVAENQETKNS
ncbi:restriction endonuclease subunit S [Dictyobacter arantiisoli]|uniref:Type I restriction modification DNA specificity domain-containing protein n=1 Tax=Dictyobacter arantiisoli TaxID=2014874 RepID=A0A5A5TGR0_9CHLR|nr:restriction endonuclease subunit S [Dictyobacter arantiisoli]GCF10547.1 hypothetical protein KDI_41110 [Dictyobacter arantiisoli]